MPAGRNSRHSAFTQPLFSYAPVATWHFYPPDGPPEVLYQVAPNLYPVADVVDFVTRAHRHAGHPHPETLTLAVPGGGAWRPPVSGRSPDAGPTHPTARVCWLFWAELLTPAGLADVLRKTRQGRGRKGFVWTVWVNPDDSLDGAFVAHDAAGRPNPVFDIPRGPFADLVPALTVTDRLANFIDEF